MIVHALYVNPRLFLDAPWDMSCGLLPSSLKTGEGSLAACLGVGSHVFSQGWLLLAAKTLLWFLHDLSLKLSSSPILVSTSALPVTPTFRVILGNFEGQTEVNSPKGAPSPCPLCCSGLPAYPGVLRWLFCTFCGYSDRLKTFFILFGVF